MRVSSSDTSSGNNLFPNIMAEADITPAAVSSMMANHNTGDLKMMMSSHAAPMNIATISAGFEKGDFLVREEQGNRVYFDFFEEVRAFVTATAIFVDDR
jgi:hypothetical protein